MTTLDILRRVRETCTADRWIQGRYSDEENRGCLIGHVGMASPERNNTHFPFRVLRHAIARIHSIDGHVSIAEWNDAPERTHADVVAVIDAAIAAEAKNLGDPLP